MSQQLRHDVAWALATYYAANTEHLVFENERADLFAFFYDAAMNALLKFEQELAGRERRLDPLKQLRPSKN